MSDSSPINKMMSFVGNMSLSRVAIFSAVLTAGYFTVMYDSGDSIIQAIEAGKAQLQVENTKKIETQKVLKKEQQMKADVELFAKKFEEIKSKIPIDFPESELRSTVDMYASKNNLKTVRSERRQSQTMQGAAKGEENLVDQVGLSYEFEGNYVSIARFVSDLSSLEKLIKVADFNLSQILNRPVLKGKVKALSFRVDIIGFKQSLNSLKNSSASTTPAKADK